MLSLIACTCWYYTSPYPTVFNTEPVPTNAAFVSWFADWNESAVDLLGPDVEDVIPTETVDFGDGMAKWHRPVEPLAPVTDYHVNIRGPNVDNIFWLFTTGEEADTTPPDTPVLAGARHGHQRFGLDSCSNPLWITLDVEPVSEPLVVYEVEYAEDDTFSGPHRALRAGAPITWSTGSGCGWPLPTGWGDRWWWRVRAVDLAGNTSDWSEPVREKVPGGCATAPSSAAWAVPAALLALLGRRRRTSGGAGRWR